MSNKNNIHAISRAVITHQDKILLCKTVDLKQNFYYLPGGHIEHGESAKHALGRELKEEIGFECSIQDLLGCLEYSFDPGQNSICHTHEYNFIFRAASTQLTSNRKILSPENHIDLIWVPIPDLAIIDLRAEPLKKLLPMWISGTSTPEFISEMI